MRRGALMMFDALGFKGIWNRKGITGEQVISKLRALAEKTDRAISDNLGPNREHQGMLDVAKIAFLSDTVVMGVAARPELGAKRKEFGVSGSVEEMEAQFDVMALLWGCSHACKIIRLALDTAPALAYRGTIAFGDFEMDGNFIVGRAVDDAASTMDEAQLAAVWLAPNAAALIDQAKMFFEHHHPLIRYRIPLKGGDGYETFAINPLFALETANECTAVEAKMLETFSGPLAVQVKKQHTADFLRASVGRAPREEQRAEDLTAIGAQRGWHCVQQRAAPRPHVAVVAGVTSLSQHEIEAVSGVRGGNRRMQRQGAHGAGSVRRWRRCWSILKRSSPRVGSLEATGRFVPTIAGRGWVRRRRDCGQSPEADGSRAATDWS